MNANLQESSIVVLRRARNGWLVNRETGSFLDSNKILEAFCFESTKSLCAKLPALIGEGKWRIEMPKRDATGKFLPTK